MSSSAHKRATNRANARSSTGPKTARGKAHSSQNARRHGLSLSVLSDPLLVNEVEALAKALVGKPAATEEIYQLARRVAATQLELRRVRWGRHQLLFEAMNDPDWDSEANHREKLSAVIRCARTGGPLTQAHEDVVELVRSRPEGSEKVAMILSDKLPELFVLDRYERRALSKRKSAIRALDEAWRRLAADG